MIHIDGFSEQYAKACEARTDAMAEDILDIADDGTNDYVEREREDGSTYEVTNNEAIQRSKLRVDTRKWLMAKTMPKKYGEKLDLTTGGDKINRSASDAELDAIIARATARQAGKSTQA
jgi:hypothetical protein